MAGWERFTAARREAFLAELARHGHINNAADACDISRSTIYLVRNREPAFEAAVQEAILAAARGLMEAAEQDGLGSLGGDGAGLKDNPWLRARLAKKVEAGSEAKRARPGRSRAELERSVLAKLEVLGRRLARDGDGR